ncbi:hypothetical protein MTO96_048034 [Rhipicephalus appendiculatus]
MSSGFQRSHPIHKHGLSITEGDRWKRNRSLLTPAFTTSNMKKMVSLMNDSADKFIGFIGSMRTKHEALEFRELFQRMTADVIIRSAFGLKSDLQRMDRTESTAESLFQQTLDVFQEFRRSWLHFLTACFPEFTPLWRIIVWYSSRHNKTPIDNAIDEIASIVQFRRKNPENTRCDLLQLMLNAEVKDEDLADVHSLTASDGDDNVSEEKKLVGVNNSDKMRVLTNAEGEFTYDNVTSIKYMDQVISESLRLFTPIIGFTTRRCADAYIHKSIIIPAGTSILIPNFLLSRDSAFWKEPEKFDPERFSSQNKAQIDPSVYQPFGQGPRNCVGRRFALLEMKFTMAKLLAKYKLFLADRHIQVRVLFIDLAMFYNGAHPFLIVKDLELIKKIQIADFNNFHSRGVMKLMDDSTDEFIDAIEVLRSKHEAFEFRELCQRLTADVMIRSSFGLKSNLLRKDGTNSIAESLFQESVKTFKQFRHTWINFLTPCFPEFSAMWRMIISYSFRNSKTATDKTMDEIIPIIQFRRENPEKDRNDLLQMMLNAEVEDAPINVHSLTASLDVDATCEETKTIKTANEKGKIFLTNEEVLATGFAFFMAGFSPENKSHIDPVVYQPFGQGPRNCAGMRFAQLEIKLTMAKLLSRYKLVLDDRHIQEKDLTIETTFILAYPKNGIWLKVEKL